MRGQTRVGLVVRRGPMFEQRSGGVPCIHRCDHLEVVTLGYTHDGGQKTVGLCGLCGAEWVEDLTYEELCTRR